jgi:hypothetical protein
MSVGNEYVAVVGDDNIGWRIEAVLAISWFARCA